MKASNFPNGSPTTMQDEAGAAENRLSLNPTDPRWKESVGNWEDGKTYTLNIQVSQISPGEFEVVGAKESQSDAQGDEEAGESPTQSESSEPQEAQYPTGGGRPATNLVE